MEKTTLFYVIIGILMIQYMIHQLLEFLNAKRFASNVPEELSDVFDDNEYQKSQQYKIKTFLRNSGIIYCIFFSRTRLSGFFFP